MLLPFDHAKDTFLDTTRRRRPWRPTPLFRRVQAGARSFHVTSLVTAPPASSPITPGPEARAQSDARNETIYRHTDSLRPASTLLRGLALPWQRTCQQRWRIGEMTQRSQQQRFKTRRSNTPSRDAP